LIVMDATPLRLMRRGPRMGSHIHTYVRSREGSKMHSGDYFDGVTSPNGYTMLRLGRSGS
jgi:hypothetical protein